MILGAHVSISGGFDKCIDRSHQLGSNCLMTFASSPRSLQTKALPPEVIKKYLEKKDKSGMGPHFFHAPYLVNLASDSKSFLNVSRDTLVFYQQTAGAINAVGTIFHIGYRQEPRSATLINQIVAAVNFILDSSPKGVRLILENAAGHSGSIGASLEELGEIISRVGDRSKIGVCLDTQHLFAAGYPLDTALNKFHRAVGLKYLSVIHVNDSKTDFDSKVDRHANLGDGKIGKEALKRFITDPRLKHLPFILEVPGDGKSGPRKSDVDTLRSLAVQ